MKNLLIVTDTSGFDAKTYLMADLVVKLRYDGTYIVIKNRVGPSKIGKIGELLDLRTIPTSENETIFKD